MTTLAYNSAFYKEHIGRDHLQRKFQSNQVFTPARIDRSTISEDKYVPISLSSLASCYHIALKIVSLQIFTVFTPPVDLAVYYCTDDLKFFYS